MYNRRIHAIVRADRVTEINSAIVAALGADYDGCLSVPLSATGANPPTHYGASSQETDASRAAILPLLDPAQGVYGWPGQTPGDEYTANTVTDANNLPACAPSDMRWTFEAAAQSIGLLKIQGNPF